MLPSHRDPNSPQESDQLRTASDARSVDGPTPFLAEDLDPGSPTDDARAEAKSALARERDYLRRTREVQYADLELARQSHLRHVEELERLRQADAGASAAMIEELRRELDVLRTAIEAHRAESAALAADRDAWRARADRPLPERVLRTLRSLPKRLHARGRTTPEPDGSTQGPAAHSDGDPAAPTDNGVGHVPALHGSEPVPADAPALGHADPAPVAGLNGRARGATERGTASRRTAEPADGSATHTDVLVLGSGLAGSTAALCLARKGLRVVLLDQGTHPRFALGESTTTPSSLWLKVLAERFDAPELDHLTTAEGVRRHVAPTSGVKSNFGFLYHEEGAATMRRSWQAVIAQAEFSDADQGPPQSSEMHYFRQDVDAYLWSTALGAGAVGRPGCRVEALEFHGEGATARTSAGETIEARFVIDASGYRSVVAETLGLREDPPRMRTNSRAMFTHMTGVRPYEEVDEGPKPLAPWSQGTLHHFFDGGWMWVIPFGNFPGSQNRLCSVGLSFDNERFPRDPDVSAEEAWADFLAKHPSIAKQFEGAVPVRPWTTTDRLQYSSTKCVGDRFWMTAHAAGTVDALYSMGNINTFQSLATGLRLVLEAFERDRFDEEHFQPLQRLTDNLLRFQDRIVYGNYQAFRAPELLEQWFTLWGLTDGARVREILKPLVTYARTRRMEDLTTYDACPEAVFTGLGQSTGIIDADEALDLLDSYCDIMQELQEGRATVDETAERLRDAIESDERFDVHIDDVRNGLGKLPWLFAPLREFGLKTYSSAFLTPHENVTLGVEASGLPAPEPRRLKPWEEERALFVEHTANLERDRDNHREHAARLERELRAEVEAYRSDRDAWCARAKQAEAQVAKSLPARVRRALGRR